MNREPLNSTRWKQLEDQNHECAYCGKVISIGAFVAKAYDNTGIVHLNCACIGRAVSADEMKELDS